MAALLSAITFVVVVQLCLGAFDQHHARAAEPGYAVVTQGAFLLSEEPELPRTNPRFHRLTGYLPIGTRVWIEGSDSEIYNRSEDRMEDYFFVRSELGIDGLIREDLLVRPGDRPLAVPFAMRKVELYRKPYARDEKPDDCDQDDGCIYFSRNDDVHLEILDESDESYYKVMLHRHRPVRDYPMEETGWISKNRVKYGSVKVIDTELDPAAMAQWVGAAPPAGEDSRSVEEIIAEFKDQISDSDLIRCRISVSGQSSVGVNTSFIPFVNLDGSISTIVPLKEKDRFKIEEAYELKEGDEQEKFEIERDITCENSRPARMQELTLRPEAGPSARILLQDIDTGESQWIQSLKGPEAPTKMVALDSWEAYDAIHTKLQEMINEGGGHISELEDLDQQILLNFIIQQIAYYTHPKKDFAGE